MVAVVPIPLAPVGALDQPIAPEKILSGAPKTGFRAAHDDAAAGFWSGVWESEVGAWRIAYEETELCVMLAGRVRLVDEAGTAQEFATGDAFVIPRGFVGVWETLEPCRKIYAITA